jgi:hypothetical protein
MNWEVYGRKRWWPNWRYYVGIYLEWLKNTTENLGIVEDIPETEVKNVTACVNKLGQYCCQCFCLLSLSYGNTWTVALMQTTEHDMISAVHGRVCRGAGHYWLYGWLLDPCYWYCPQTRRWSLLGIRCACARFRGKRQVATSHPKSIGTLHALTACFSKCCMFSLCV